MMAAGAPGRGRRLLHRAGDPGARLGPRQGPNPLPDACTPFDALLLGEHERDGSGERQPVVLPHEARAAVPPAPRTPDGAPRPDAALDGSSDGPRAGKARTIRAALCVEPVEVLAARPVSAPA